MSREFPVENQEEPKPDSLSIERGFWINLERKPFPKPYYIGYIKAEGRVLYKTDHKDTMHEAMEIIETMLNLYWPEMTSEEKRDIPRLYPNEYYTPPFRKDEPEDESDDDGSNWWRK